MIFLLNLYNLFQDTGLPDFSPDQTCGGLLLLLVLVLVSGLEIMQQITGWTFYNAVSFCHFSFIFLDRAAWTSLNISEYLNISLLTRVYGSSFPALLFCLLCVFGIGIGIIASISIGTILLFAEQGGLNISLHSNSCGSRSVILISCFYIICVVTVIGALPRWQKTILLACRSCMPGLWWVTENSLSPAWPKTGVGSV